MRAVHSVLLPTLALAAAACGEVPSGPASAPGLLAASASHADVSEFVAIQGTWCDRDLPGDCDALDALGIGWINAFYDGTAPIVTLDPGGVNARWYADHREAHWIEVPAYAVINGTVNERALPDGRREVKVRIRVENTFTAFYDLDDQPLLGASFEEFGTVDPALATIDFEYRAILPAGFEGLPDLVQPEAWDEMTRLDATIRTSAVLRGELRGLPAGTPVDIVYRIREIPHGGGRSAKPNFGYAMSIRAAELTVTRQAAGS